LQCALAHQCTCTAQRLKNGTSGDRCAIANASGFQASSSRLACSVRSAVFFGRTGPQVGGCVVLCNVDTVARLQTLLFLLLANLKMG
jgi:hypothetical protein